MKRRFLPVIILVSQIPLLSQIGRYPGGYPPSQYPGSQIPGVPFPWPGGGRRGGDTTNAPARAPQRSTGKLRKIDGKSLVLETADGRILDFSRDTKTKFYKDAKETSEGAFKSGDEVSVEATEDRRGYLYARSVSLIASADTATSAPARDETAKTPSAAPAPDPGDPGPPTLRRGIPPKRPAANVEESESPTADPAPRPAAGDPVIEHARAAAETFTERLPNYVCKEYMARFASNARPVDWQALDVVSANVVYEDGRESYRNVAVNGRATNKGMEALDGSWSTGEFASVLVDLFSPSTAAIFRLERTAAAAGMSVRVYGFDVRKPNSHWRVQAASQTIFPAYEGSVWIEPKSGRVLRIEIQARALPAEYPMDRVETAVDYENVRIGGREFLLPAHAESLSCQRGTNNCTRNTIDFRNYHAYEADSTVAFEGAGK